MTQELILDPALRERMALALFTAHIGRGDAAKMAATYTREQMLVFSRPYGIFIDTVVGMILAEGGTLPGATMQDVDPLA